MTFVEVPPPADLARVATRLWHLETVPVRRFEKILPLPSVHLIVNLSEPYCLFDRPAPARRSWMRSSPACSTSGSSSSRPPASGTSASS